MKTPTNSTITPKGFFAQLFCFHAPTIFVRKVYGGEIVQNGYKRYQYQCCKCGRMIFSNRKPALKNTIQVVAA